MQIRKKNYRWWHNSNFLKVQILLKIVILLFLFLTWPITLHIAVLESEVVYLQPLADDWQKRNPNIRINLEPFKTTDSIEEDYTKSFTPNNSISRKYDLVYMDIIWLPKFAESGWLRELDEEFTQAELEPFLDNEIKRGRAEKNKLLYRIPFRTDVGVLFYREDLLKKSSQPPKTFTELLEASLEISKNFQNPNSTFWGYLWQAGKYEALVTTFLEVLSAYGGCWICPDSAPDKVGLDSQEVIKAIQFLRSTIDKKVSPPYTGIYEEDIYLRKFKKGEAAFLRSWPDSWARFNNADDSQIEGKVGLTQVVGVNNNSAGCLGGWGFGIPKNTRHLKAALRAMKFFTSQEVQRKFVLESSYLPSRTELFSDPEIQKKYPHFPKMLEIVKNAINRPQISNYDGVSKILQCHLSIALSSDSDLKKIEATMKIAANKTRNLLNNKKIEQSICENI